MALNKTHQQNFDTLARAFALGHVALMECTDAATGKPVAVLCAVERHGDEVEMKPFAKMFEGNPYEQVFPPELPESVAQD